MKIPGPVPGGEASRVEPREASVERSGTGSSPSKSVEMVQRLTYRRRHSYATKSNRVKKVKTPGGKLTYHYVAKKSNPAVDPMDQQILNGIPVLRPAKGKFGT